MRLLIDDKTKKELIKKQYRIVGNHSAIEICSWTKRALLNHEPCYKQQFYGVDTHRCAQITPCAVWCDQRCIFCWRPAEYMKSKDLSKFEVDEPKEIIEKSIEGKRNLLNGFLGNEKVDKKLLDEAYNKFPSHWAISLSGEPTLYPKLPELILELKKNKEVKSIFVVTNGQHPEMLKKLQEKNTLPTQLYLSLDVGNEKKFLKVNKPLKKNAWNNLMKTIELFPDLNTRRVIRFTLIKGLNDSDEDIKELVELFNKSDSDFVEVKAYMHIGYSQKRLEKKNMPLHYYVKEFVDKLLENRELSSNFKFMDENVSSRIICLRNKNSKFDRWIKKPDY